MQVMACMAIMGSSYGSDSTNGNNDNNNDGNASKDSAQSSAGLEDGGDSLQFGFVDYVLLVINMLGMAMGLLGMRGSQNFELDTVKTYVKGLITTGVVSMMLKVYWLLRVASEISDGTYPGLGDSDDSAAGHTGPSGGAAGGDSSPADSSATSSSSLSSDKQLTGSDVMSDALFSTAVAVAIWFYCFYRAVQFRNQLQAASGPRREATRELHATAAAAAV
uniref:Uncharacterized protein n=1 Tax=Heterosigma akashiwo TaxID=2829 RepID=A0A7S3XT57_HETAK